MRKERQAGPSERHSATHSKTCRGVAGAPVCVACMCMGARVETSQRVSNFAVHA